MALPPPHSLHDPLESATSATGLEKRADKYSRTIQKLACIKMFQKIIAHTIFWYDTFVVRLSLQQR